jgi:hypothetical protein
MTIKDADLGALAASLFDMWFGGSGKDESRELQAKCSKVRQGIHYFTKCP